MTERKITPGGKGVSMEEGEARPVPDPTVLTTAQLVRTVQAERDYVDGQIAVLRERLRGIDVATIVLNETVNRVPTDMQKEIGHIVGLMEEKFRSVATQFTERDTRSERESKDNKVAVDAAFAAQKEAASEQNKSNTLAISKSETATSETINKLAELFATTTDALGDKIDDVKARVGSIESAKQAVFETRATGTASSSLAVQVLSLLLAVIVAGFVIYVATHK